MLIYSLHINLLSSLYYILSLFQRARIFRNKSTFGFCVLAKRDVSFSSPFGSKGSVSVYLSFSLFLDELYCDSRHFLMSRGQLLFTFAQFLVLLSNLLSFLFVFRVFTDFNCIILICLSVK